MADWRPLPERCTGCIHRAAAYVFPDGDMTFCCMYIADRYQPRGCPADETCTRYEPGKRKRGWYLEPVYPV